MVPTMPMAAISLRRGDLFLHTSAGGGGFGPAFEREAGLVAEDVREGKVSPRAARERYGVILDGVSFVVDEAATLACRSAMRQAAE